VLRPIVPVLEPEAAQGPELALVQEPELAQVQGLERAQGVVLLLVLLKLVWLVLWQVHRPNTSSR
jgi:hypothetical protein